MSQIPGLLALAKEAQAIDEYCRLQETEKQSLHNALKQTEVLYGAALEREAELKESLADREQRIHIVEAERDSALAQMDGLTEQIRELKAQASVREEAHAVALADARKAV